MRPYSRCSLPLAPRHPHSLGNLRYNNVDIVDVQALNRNRPHFAVLSLPISHLSFCYVPTYETPIPENPSGPEKEETSALRKVHYYNSPHTGTSLVTVALLAEATRSKGVTTLPEVVYIYLSPREIFLRLLRVLVRFSRFYDEFREIWRAIFHFTFENISFFGRKEKEMKYSSWFLYNNFSTNPFSLVSFLKMMKTLPFIILLYIYIILFVHIYKYIYMFT